MRGRLEVVFYPFVVCTVAVILVTYGQRAVLTPFTIKYCPTIMVEFVTRYINYLLEMIRKASADIKRDFGMMVSKKFYDGIKYLLYINRIIGLFPISVTQKGDSYFLKWSWLKVIIGNFFVLLYGLLTLTGLALSYNIEEVYNIRIKGLPALLVTLAEIITLFCTWLLGQASVSILFKEFWKYLSYLSKADEIMGPVEPTRKSVIMIIIVFTFTFTCLGMDIYMWANIAVPIIGIFSFIWKMVPFYFTYVFTMILEINFLLTIYGIAARVKKLNTLMSSYIQLAGESETSRSNNRCIDDFGNERNKLRVSNGKGKSLLEYKMLTSTMVKSFINVYGHIAQANIALNNFFGVSMTMMLFNIIVCLVITPYVLYQQILNAKENKFLFTQSYWMTCHILRLLLFIEPCHVGQTQGIEIKKSVLKMLCLDLPKDAHKQVKILLLVVTENNIEFDAKGMTFINRTLLPTIGSAVFTYLAIIFQYKNNT